MLGVELPVIDDPMLHAVTAIRWGVLIFGLSLSSAATYGPPWGYATATALLVFNASWRTIRPVTLQAGAATSKVLRFVAPDLLVALLAAGATAAWSGPYALAAAPAVLLAAHLGGAAAAAAVLAVDVLVLVLLELLIHPDGGSGASATVAALVVVAVVGTAAGRAARSPRAHQLSDMWLLNRLLTSMHRLTRTSNISLDLDDVLAATRDRIRATFDVSSVVIAAHGVAGSGWRIVLVDGPAACDVQLDDVARVAATAVEHGGTLLGDDLAPLAGASGMCQPLLAEDVVVGAVLVEHELPGRYGNADLAALRALAGPVALAIDNARWFRRIRTVAADEERVRIARELHDGVAQSLVAVHLDLGRLDDHQPEILRARLQVEGALVSLRESLIDLRAGVTASTPLSTLAKEAVARLEERVGVVCHLDVVEVAPNLPPRVEHEVWRILQEALANVEKHADASEVVVRWTLDEREALLEVVDDGKGFDVRATRHVEFGLRGMVERADAIGASLRIYSDADLGTTVLLRLHR